MAVMAVIVTEKQRRCREIGLFFRFFFRYSIVRNLFKFENIVGSVDIISNYNRITEK